MQVGGDGNCPCGKVTDLLLCLLFVFHTHSVVTTSHESLTCLRVLVDICGVFSSKLEFERLNTTLLCM